MKKILLGGFILFDLALIGGSGFVLFTYVSRKMPSKLHMTGTTTPVVTPAASPAAGTPAAPTGKAIGSGLVTPGAAVDTSTRKILFSYRNPHAKIVSIRADFTGWKAEPMQKAANGSWTYQAQLAPGEYAYCYTADDKTFKDPFNKRTKQIGRTLVSAIVVGAAPSKPAK